MTVVDDVRHAWRGLLRAPGFFVLASGTLALGIAINAAMFSILNAAFFEPPPYATNTHLYTVVIAPAQPARPASDTTFREVASLVAPFGEAAAYSEDRFVVAVGGVGGPEVEPGLRVDLRTFAVLNVQPRLGRGFSAEDLETGAAPVVVVGDAFWRARLGGTEAALGRTVRIDGLERVVVGVLPPDFSFPDVARIYLPLQQPGERRVGRDEGVLVRLDDVRRADPLVRTLQSALGGNGALNVALRPLDEPAGAMVAAMLAAIAFVLLIACANVANLVLARGTTRAHELRVRGALGASRARLVRQFASEGALLALVAVGAGLLASVWLIDIIVAAIPGHGLPAWFHPTPDGRVMAYVGLLALVAVLVASVLPAISLTRDLSLTAALTAGALGFVDRRSKGLRTGLVVVQVALATVLLTATGLLIRGFQATRAFSPGYDAGAVLEVPLYRPPVRDAATDSLVREAMSRLGTLPGVTATGAVAARAAFGQQAVGSMRPDVAVDTICVPATAGALAAMRLPLVLGRVYRDDDTAPVAVLGRSLARRLFDVESSAIGATLSFADDPAGTRFTVIGVVGDRGYPRVGGSRLPHVYVPFRFGNPTDVSLVARASSGEPSRLAAAASSMVRPLDPDMVVAPARTMLVTERERISDLDWFISLFGGFGLAAIFLATLGIYGVAAFSVSRRTRELGIRLALGASRRRVMAQVAGSIVPAAASGLALGIVLAAGMGMLLRSVLFGVPAVDWLTLAAVATLFLAVTLGAGLRPALRASRVDPAQALRAQ